MDLNIELVYYQLFSKEVHYGEIQNAKHFYNLGKECSPKQLCAISIKENNKVFLQELEAVIPKGYEYLDYWLRGLISSYVKRKSLQNGDTPYYFEYYYSWLNNTRLLLNGKYPIIEKWCDEYEISVKKELEMQKNDSTAHKTELVNQKTEETKEVEQLFEQYESATADFSKVNNGEIINLYHRWHEKAMILFRKFFTTTDEDYIKIKSIDNSGNGFRLHDNFQAIRCDWNILIDRIKNKSAQEKNTETMIYNNDKVFIVHGHDDAAKESVARFLEKQGLTAIILHEQANSGRTIIEKLAHYTDVGYAIVLYTPCDKGGENNTEAVLNPRARQNVVFEHGFLIGKLGRYRVCALMKELDKGKIEDPGDISGVVYITMDKKGAWKFEIAKEMRAIGFNIDLNKI